MSRRARHDYPDTWHHVMSRGIARRTIFETDEDCRFFLAALAREVRAGRLEVHAFSLMLTHFHLLVRSPTGELSTAMKHVLNRYSRWFNRTRRRDGPLYRGRFLSRPVDSLRYRRRVVEYIHDNAVAAGLVPQSERYEWASAFHLAAGARPRWLATSWVDAEVGRRGGEGSAAARLARAFPSRIDRDFRQWVESQLNQRLPQELDDATFKHAGSPRVVRWAIRKAKLADGTRAWRPASPAGVVDRAVQKARRRCGPLLGLFKRATKDAWVTLRAALLRLLAGCTHYEIGLRVDRHASTISRDERDHRLLLHTSPRYASLAARVGDAILALR